MVSLLALFLAGASPAVAVDNDRSFPIQAQGMHCPRTTSVHAFDRNQRVVPRKLGEMPPRQRL